MSATITISPKGLLSKKLTIRDVVAEELAYGIPDAYYRLEEGKTGDYTLIYSPEQIGRGFEIHFDGKETELHLNYPNSRSDIELCYMIVARVCKLQGVKTFVYEGETAHLSEIEQYIQRDVDTSVQTLRRYAALFADGETHSLLFFGALNPLSIGEKEIARFGDDIDKFGEWLNEIQQRDVYYAAPHFYRKNGDAVFGSFAVKAGVASVVPLTPEVPFTMHDRLTVNEWYVMLGNAEDDGEMKIIPYEKMIESVTQSGGGEYYDAAHIVITLTDAQVDKWTAQYAVSP